MAFSNSFPAFFPSKYSTSRKSLNKRLASGRVLRLRPPPHRTYVRLRSSARVCVRPRASARVCVRLRASACVACVQVSKYIYVCVRVRASAFVCVQTIKSPDASRRKWISASERVFYSRTFGMYYMHFHSPILS